MLIDMVIMRVECFTVMVIMCAHLNLNCYGNDLCAFECLTVMVVMHAHFSVDCYGNYALVFECRAYLSFDYNRNHKGALEC